MSLHPPAADGQARRYILSGRVQAVGFRPFVYRLARALGLRGWVLNRAGRVVIHVEGLLSSMQQFEAAVISEAPPLAQPVLHDSLPAEMEDCAGFTIRDSDSHGPEDVHIPPDLFCCDDCVDELRTPGQRRFRYPFTNCTQCGPRYTLIAALPYDRPNTAMAAFALCPSCRAEYENPADRRFHAQPLACPECGPYVSFERQGQVIATGGDALAATTSLLRDGGIVAVKGVGGYHLMCDAANVEAVRCLRVRKHRPQKPLAVMAPLEGDDGLASLRRIVALDAEAAAACRDPLRPIILVRKKQVSELSHDLAPGLDELGVFLPYSPLHHILLEDFGAPLVATSGNISGEPVITNDDEARQRLGSIADALLTHNRLILRPADDSVRRIIAGKPRTFRLGRGLSPLERQVNKDVDQPILSTGGQMKSTLALGWQRRAVLSSHIGALDTRRGMDVFRQMAADLQALYGVEAEILVCDLHPGFAARRWAESTGLPLYGVQHHEAHASALAGEYPGIASWLVFTWDGVGLGGDGDLWGGEALLGKPGAWQRVASMRPFHLLGGDRAARQPWRSAASLMWEDGRDWRAEAGTAHDLAHEAWHKRIGTRRSSAVGRLFDAAAALVLGVSQASFEGQGPMLLEAVAAHASAHAVALPLVPDASGLLRADWAPLLPVLLDDKRSAACRSACFHESLAVNVVDQVRSVAAHSPIEAVGLTGGVFQNRLLAERVVHLLGNEGYRAILPADIPANDGGLAFGQLIEVLHGGGERLN